MYGYEDPVYMSAALYMKTQVMSAAGYIWQIPGNKSYCVGAAVVGEPVSGGVEGSVVDGELEGTVVDGELEETVEGVPVGIADVGAEVGKVVTGVLEGGGLGTTVAGTTKKNQIRISVGDDRYGLYYGYETMRQSGLWNHATACSMKPGEAARYTVKVVDKE